MDHICKHVCKQNCKQDNWKTRAEIDQLLIRTQALNQIKFYSTYSVRSICIADVTVTVYQNDESEWQWKEKIISRSTGMDPLATDSEIFT